MISISRIITTEEKKEIITNNLTFDGDYLDILPLFEIMNTSNPNAFIKSSEFRTKYMDNVQLFLGNVPTMIVSKSPKRIMYHKWMIKLILNALGLLELEGIIADHWDLTELPMLEQDQFDYWDMELAFYDNDGSRRDPKIVRIFRRRYNGWINLTSCSAEYDGDDVVTRKPVDIAKNNFSLYRQLWIVDRTADEVKANDITIASKTTSGADAKKQMMLEFVDTHYCRGETWCHPAVFIDTMMSLSTDFRLKICDAIMNPFGEANVHRVLKTPVLSDIKYIQP